MLYIKISFRKRVSLKLNFEINFCIGHGFWLS